MQDNYQTKFQTFVSTDASGPLLVCCLFSSSLLAQSEQTNSSNVFTCSGGRFTQEGWNLHFFKDPVRLYCYVYNFFHLFICLIFTHYVSKGKFRQTQFVSPSCYKIQPCTKHRCMYTDHIPLTIHEGERIKSSSFMYLCVSPKPWCSIVPNQGGSMLSFSLK